MLISQELGPQAPIKFGENDYLQMYKERRVNYVPPRRKIELPHFVKPCKLIMRDMKKILRVKTKNSLELSLASKIIVARLRRTFVLGLESCSYMPTDEIVNLFREQHPKTKDKEFVANVLDDIRACFWPGKKQRQKIAAKLKKAGKNDGNTGTTGIT